MKTLLCLLSDQHVPNLLSIHQLCPDRLVMVESAGMKQRRAAENLLEALKFGGLDYHARADVVSLTDENDLEAIRTCLRTADGQHAGADWVVNLTGGTKPMSIAAYEFFRDRPARLVYAPIGQPDRLLDLRGGPAEDCSYRPNIQEFLAGYGFGLRKPMAAVAERESRLRFLPQVAFVIAQHCTLRPLLELNSGWDDQQRRRWWEETRKRGATLAPGEVAVGDEVVRKEICRVFNLTAEEKWIIGRINPVAADFLTGGWLEVMFWDLLKRHAAALGAWDVHLGLEVRDRASGSENELDVVFMRRHGLCWVECKSGSQTHDREADVLYKIAAVTRQFRALRARGFLAITSDTVLRSSPGGESAIKLGIARRAELYDCPVITRDQIVRLATRPDDQEEVRRAFAMTEV